MGAADSVVDFIQVLDVLRTSVSAKTKRILAQLGSVTGRTVDSVNAQWMQQVGLVSRPPKPDAGRAAARCLVVRRGNTDVVVASEDDRGLDLMGSLADGETCLYAAGADGDAQARVLLKADGSIHLYTRKGNTSSGAGMVVQLDAANGAIRLLNDQGAGIVIEGTSVKITSGGAALSLDGNDAQLIAKGNAQVDGSGVVIGSIAVPGVNSALTGVTGVAGKASLKVLIE